MELVDMGQIDRSTYVGFVKYWKQRPQHFEDVFKVPARYIEELAPTLVNEKLFKNMEFASYDGEYYSNLAGEL